eukprot:6701343-Pyramimonas_sp.AAC.1
MVEKLAGKHVCAAGGDWNLDPNLDSTGLARRGEAAFLRASQEDVFVSRKPHDDRFRFHQH